MSYAIDAGASVRLARPSRDLAAAERFYVGGLGLAVLYRGTAAGPGEHDLLMVGLPGATWHLELVADPSSSSPSPTPSDQDLLVVYLGEPIPADLIDRVVAAGGRQVSQGPYWDRWGVTFADPDGYRTVLSTRTWQNTPAH